MGTNGHKNNSNKLLPLSQIILEDDFRKKIEDPMLSLSTSKRGLDDNLVVEGPNEENKYVLVHGYRRYYALVYAGSLNALCTVEECTNKTERIIKRLRKEFHTRKRTGYEVEMMIFALSDAGLSENEIAKRTDFTTATVKKYIKTRDIDDNIRSLSQQNGKGRDGLIKILNFPNSVKQRVKELFLNRYLTERSIRGTDIDSMVKVAKVPQFEELSESAQIKCLNQAIDQTGFTAKNAEAIVFEQAIYIGYDQRAHSYLYDRTCEQLELICKLKLVSSFYDNLSTEQRKYLNILWKKASIPVTPPIEWSNFPEDRPKYEGEPNSYN